MTKTATRKDAIRSRRAILDAAANLLADRRPVSFAEIAHAAGLGQATVYRHFDDHRALLTALAEESLDQVEARFRTEPIDERSFEALLRLLVDDQLRLQGLASAIRAGEVDEEEVERLGGRTRELFREPLRAAIAAGVVDATVTVEDALLVLAMVDGALRYACSPSEREHDAERALALALDGLGGRPARRPARAAR